MKVRLIKDLTDYGPTLVEGAEGLGREKKVEVNDWGQEMIEVKIAGTDALLIGWNALEIIDKKFWKDREQAIKRSERITLHTGPRGGYKGMRIEWVDSKGLEQIVWCNSKIESEKCVEIAKTYGKYILKEYK